MIDTRTTPLSKKIAQIFYWFCLLLLVVLALACLVVLVSGPSFFMLALWFSLIYIVPIPLIVWGMTLLLRYRRLIKDKLVMSEKRLWVETILMNLVNLGFFVWVMPSFRLPSVTSLAVALLNVVAICLALRALVSKDITVKKMV